MPQAHAYLVRSLHVGTPQRERNPAINALTWVEDIDLTTPPYLTVLWSIWTAMRA